MQAGRDGWTGSASCHNRSKPDQGGWRSQCRAWSGRRRDWGHGRREPVPPPQQRRTEHRPRTTILNIDTGTASGSSGVAAGPDGKLLPLVQAGLLRPGERLIWVQHRLGNTFSATVLGRGALQLDDGRIVKSLSGACQALTGKSYDGWKEFRRESDNVLLDDLRRQLGDTTER